VVYFHGNLVRSPIGVNWVTPTVYETRHVSRKIFPSNISGDTIPSVAIRSNYSLAYIEERLQIAAGVDFGHGWVQERLDYVIINNVAVFISGSDLM
jgi:hypothetical protein